MATYNRVVLFGKITRIDPPNVFVEITRRYRGMQGETVSDSTLVRVEGIASHVKVGAPILVDGTIHHGDEGIYITAKDVRDVL